MFSFVVFAVIPKTSCQVLDRLVNWLANNSATRHTPRSFYCKLLLPFLHTPVLSLRFSFSISFYLISIPLFLSLSVYLPLLYTRQC